MIERSRPKVAAAPASGWLGFVWGLSLLACGPTQPSVDTTASDDTSTSSPSSSTGDADTDTETGAVPADIAWPETCDPFAQDCPLGAKCVPYASDGGTWNAHKCVPILGDQGPGQPCTYAGPEEATDDCDATSMCWAVEDTDGALIGECTSFCGGTIQDPLCPDNEWCPVSGDGVISLCQRLCNPLAQDCDPGDGCYWSSVNFGCTPAAGSIASGEPCGFIYDCAPGNLCIDGTNLPDCQGGGGCCAPYCNLELGPEQCAAIPGTECVAFFERGSAPQGYDNVGVCISV